MSIDFFAYGEILWDCLPSGRHAGGAPFNVTAHLAQLGVPVALISAIGQDPLGDEILAVAADKKVETKFIRRVRVGLPTGTVLVTVDERGNATYKLVQPAAWDEIPATDAALAAVAKAKAITWGSLAGRSLYNREQIDRLLSVSGPLKFFDVNLRPPFTDYDLIMGWAKRADILKLNDGEVGRLAHWLRTGCDESETPHSEAGISECCATIAEAAGGSRICVTCGDKGAAFWESGKLVTAPAPHVEVRDTVGAGDAFMAGLMCGLTRDQDPQLVLENACRLGAYVASHNGATPLLPPEITALFRA